MKANELMIGDWVNKPYGDTSQMYGSEFSNRTDWFERVHPIPLTAEILEKNGFICRDFTIELYWDYNGLIVGDCGYYYINLGNNHSMDVSYVHQLQHALRLCGLRELADNFKV